MLAARSATPGKQSYIAHRLAVQDLPSSQVCCKLHAGGSMALYSQLRRQGLLSRHAEQRRKSGGGGGAHGNASGRHQLSEANTEGMAIVPQVLGLFAFAASVVRLRCK